MPSLEPHRDDIILARQSLETCILPGEHQPWHEQLEDAIAQGVAHARTPDQRQRMLQQAGQMNVALQDWASAVLTDLSDPVPDSASMGEYMMSDVMKHLASLQEAMPSAALPSHGELRQTLDHTERAIIHAVTTPHATIHEGTHEGGVGQSLQQMFGAYFKGDGGPGR